jgi:hypothetical protein
MKTFKILLFFQLLSTVTISAQYNNGYNPGYGNSRNNGIPSSPSKVSPETIEKEKTERIEKIVSNLKDELSLDELQVIAIRNEVIKSNKNIEILMKSDISDEDKTAEFKAIQEKADKSILSYLNPVQKKLYQKLKEESTSKKEGKKKRKDKEKKENEIQKL